MDCEPIPDPDCRELGIASIETRGPFGPFIEPNGMTMQSAIADE